MKEAIGNSMVFNLVLIFTSIFIALFVGSIAYSKGFKVRNRMLDIIEKYNGFTDQTQAEIDENLAAIGYRIVDKACPEKTGGTLVANTSAYRYCIYEFQTNKGEYYGVTVFIHFDFPIIGQYIEIPLYGETRILFDRNEVQG